VGGYPGQQNITDLFRLVWHDLPGWLRALSASSLQLPLSARCKSQARTRPAIGADGVEQISTRKTFGGWLRGQPASFQDEFFGKFTDGATKRRLFNQGRLDPQQFIDPNGVALSLDELRRLEPQAFERAGL